jgi:hypothetical protein
MEPQPKRSAGEETYDIDGLGANGVWSTQQRDKHDNSASRGTHVAAYVAEAQQLL